ncbi:MAG: hypothetical protein HY826_11690 [Actinobacteria bacterium]|nr:hypothetical protein [Actinomycetota bacterium]
MIRLDAATVLLQWSTGGLFFLWVTTRHGAVGVGYGWLLRGIYSLMAIGSAVIGLRSDAVPVRDAASIAVAGAAMVALAVSVVRRAGTDSDSNERSFAPTLDLIAPSIAIAGLVAGALDAADGGGGVAVLSVLRTLVGAAFLGSVTDAMLLGHWYLVQPGLPRRHLNELVLAVGWVWPVEVVALLLPTGMVSVWSGAIDDGWHGQLGWFWAASAIATLVLLVVTRAALRERYYSAVMAATGLLYLAILTAFGTDLVARAVLAG